MNDSHPAVSPDGNKIAFQSDRLSDTNVMVINTGGTGAFFLASTSAFDGKPNWSPDGKKIVFDTNRKGDFEVYRMNVDGSKQSNLTKKPDAGDQNPDWSPIPQARK